MTDLLPCPVCYEPSPGRLDQAVDSEGQDMLAAYCRACPFFCERDLWNLLSRTRWVSVDESQPEISREVPITGGNITPSGSWRKGWFAHGEWFAEVHSTILKVKPEHWLDGLPDTKGE